MTGTRKYIYTCMYEGAFLLGGILVLLGKDLRGTFTALMHSRMIDTWEIDRGQVKNLWVGNLHVGGKQPHFCRRKPF